MLRQLQGLHAVEGQGHGGLHDDCVRNYLHQLGIRVLHLLPPEHPRAEE